MTGVAVKITEVPEQIVDAEALIATEGVIEEETVIVTVLDVALTGEAQPSEEDITQLITSPLAKAELE